MCRKIFENREKIVKNHEKLKTILQQLVKSDLTYEKNRCKSSNNV